jgi:hypothetical protein
MLSNIGMVGMFRKLAFTVGMAAVAIGGVAMAATPPTPKISKAQARAIAPKLAPGKVKEIGVNGQTGKVVENSNERTVDHDD